MRVGNNPCQWIGRLRTCRDPRAVRPVAVPVAATAEDGHATRHHRLGRRPAAQLLSWWGYNGGNGADILVTGWLMRTYLVRRAAARVEDEDGHALPAARALHAVLVEGRPG